MVFFLFIVMTLPAASVQKTQPFNYKSLAAPLIVAIVAGPPLAASLTQRGLNRFEAQPAPAFTDIAAHLFDCYGLILQYLAFGLFITMVVVVAIITDTKERP